MAITNEEKQTISYYKKNATAWSAKHGVDSKPSFWIPELNCFKKYLPEGNIIEITQVVT